MIKVLRLKDIGIFKGGLTYSPENICDKEEGILVLRSSNIQNSKISLLDNVYVNCEVSSDLLIKKGDLLICSRNGSANLVGKTAQIEDDIHATWGAFMMIFRTSYNSRYTYYLLNDSITKNKGLFSTSTINQLTNSMLGNIYVNFELDISEQEKIARYLDTKVGEIDQKVSLIEKKIERYQLLKKSIINKVVTTGLHPEAPRKDSQISWLGQIPEHWEVKRFKSIARTIKGKVVEYFDTPSDDANIVLTVDTLRNDNPQFLNYAVTSDTDQLCKVNDIIVIWDGAGVGEFLRAKEGLISSTTARIDVNKSIVNKDYFWYFGDKIEEIMKHMPTGMGIPHLNPIILSNMQFPLPPLSEQQEIASYLDQKCADIDAIIANCTAQIEKYKTLKRALINEVVTGQRTIE